MYPWTSLGRGAGQTKFASSYGNTMPFAHNQYSYPPHGHTAGPALHKPQDCNGVSVENLAQNLGAMNLRPGDSSGPVPLRENGVPSNAMYGAQHGGQVYYPLPDGSLVLSGMNGAPTNYQQYSAYTLASMHSPNFQQAPYNGLSTSVAANLPNTPHSQNWLSSQHVPREVPGLTGPRRNSWSSNEENGPQTPLYSMSGPAGYQPTVVYNGHSPNTWSTPSPHQVAKYATPQVGRTRDGDYEYMDFEGLTHQEPKIPRAIPAIHSFNDGRGTLDKILDNPHSTTNVYIRGLPPDTTDEMLHQYGARFGDIVTAKSIIDHPTRTCKGYGFINYHNYQDAENCIRAFYHRGYEAKFAKQGHNARLKMLGSDNNTNLYVSNLPKKMNDAELAAIFQSVSPDYEVSSQKILRDSQGVSRGVGFARFKTREICEKVIESFHGKSVGEGKDCTILQLRYADTEQQKTLKLETAQRRQFKANEYNTWIYGPESPYRFISPIPTNLQSPVQIRAPGQSLGQSPASPASTDCYPYCQQSETQNPLLNAEGRMQINPLPTHSIPAAVKVQISAPPTQPRHSSRVKIESPKGSTDSNATATANSSSESDDETLVSKPIAGKSDGADVVLSPTKSML